MNNGAAKGPNALQNSILIARLIGPVLSVNSHHIWTRDWRSVITAIGWIITSVGMFRIIAPQFVTFIAGAIVAHSGFFTGVGIMLLALGGFITFKGYAA
jgi:hypothetical protein